MSRIGFTGTRNGMTPEQKKSVAAIFGERGFIVFHHGACVGADTDAVEILNAERVPGDVQTGLYPHHSVAHPGVSAASGTGENVHLSRRALELSTRVELTKTHFARNRDIVNATDILIACPPCEPLPDSGGTSYTVGYARKQGKIVMIVWPSGRIETETFNGRAEL